jgi:hypothetical protein
MIAHLPAAGRPACRRQGFQKKITQILVEEKSRYLVR